MAQQVKVERALQFYEVISTEEHKFKCVLCQQVKIGKKRSNLVSHLYCSHRTEHDTHVMQQIDPLIAEQMQLKIIQCMVEQVTINGRTFSSLSDSGYVKLQEDKIKQLKGTRFEIHMNDKKYTQVKEYIGKTAKKIQEKIKAEADGQHASLMLDVASKNRNSVLGINVRYIINGRIIERCIGMVNLTERHTAKYLAIETKKCLDKYGIDLKYVKSITTDNGANVVIIVNELHEDIIKSFEEDNDACLENLDTLDGDATKEGTSELATAVEIQQLVGEILEEDAIEAELDDTDEYDEMLKGLIGELPHHVNNDTFGIRCGAHTLQLIAKGAATRSNFKSLIVLCRKIAKLFRTESYIRTIRLHDFKFILPRLNVLTRWDSDYTMVIHVLILISIIFLCKQNAALISIC